MSPRKQWTPELVGWLLAGTFTTGMTVLGFFLNHTSHLLTYTGVMGGGVIGAVSLYFRVQRRYQDGLLRETEQRALAHQDRYYRILIGQAADVFLRTDVANIIREVTPTVTAVLGYQPEALIGQDGATFIHPDDLPAVTARRQAVRQLPRETAVRAHRFRHADGSWRHMEVVSVNLLDDAQVAGYLHTLRDITDRVQTEAALREREERLRLMTEHSSDIITLYSATGETLYASPATQSILGYSPEEYATATPAEVVHPDDLAAVLTARHSAESGRQASVTFRMRSRQGEYRWVETLSTPIFDEEGRLIRIQASTRDITERKLVEDQLTHVAYHDALTGLPNRAACLLDLDALLRTGGQDAALLFLDLDNFKLINDSLGHEAGDKLLVEIAARLQAFVGRTGMAARLAGDEFVVLLQGVRTVAEVTGAARDLLDRIGSPARLGRQQVYPACSVGIVQVSARHRTPDDLLRDADLALHVAKTQGKAGYSVFDPAMLQEAMNRLQLETDLREATGTGQLSLVYQPITSLESGEIYAMEALLRWHNPERGPISPAEFIPVAEETGLIVPIGRWVLEQACREASTWAGRFGRPLRLSVNLSAVQVRQADLALQVAAILAETGLPASELKLELTETALMSHADSSTLQALRNLGVRLAIDDFGTGFSSLNYLRRFPVDVLKIDRSFVSGLGQQPEDTALVRAVIELASALGLRV
ncbi:MAG TPA: EAL domain-containing protein, partial [Symbiobacteriaceae bacterium]|nr:EAL domain-containing protein [Symbiobacteriaceae bacterium]